MKNLEEKAGVVLEPGLSRILWISHCVMRLAALHALPLFVLLDYCTRDGTGHPIATKET